MSEVTYQSRGRVALITIDRASKKNTLTKQVVDELNAAWLRFNASDDRVAVLTGAGDDAFSAGADLSDIPHDLWRAIPGIGVEVEKPVIAAVAGWVIGGGLVLVQFADIVVAAENAKFIYPEAKVGFAGGLIASLSARIPHKIVMELLLTGDAIDAPRAYEVGLVNRVVPVGGHVDAALAYAEKIADNAPLVLALLKRFVGRTLPKGPSEAAGIARREVDGVTLPKGPSEAAGIARREVDGVTFSLDIEEGLAAFKAKRKPEFEGL